MTIAPRLRRRCGRAACASRLGATTRRSNRPPPARRPGDPRAAGVIRGRQEGTRSFVRLRREDLDARFPGLLDAILAADRDGVGAQAGIADDPTASWLASTGESPRPSAEIRLICQN
ncbi:hypothetical protein Q5762_01350 [Streptomyces sp. P9(2023)]|nr:hypothetical protein [Streptomyces sp. P9(2023)]